jgi:hypothetical protein
MERSRRERGVRGWEGTGAGWILELPRFGRHVRACGYCGQVQRVRAVGKGFFELPSTRSRSRVAACPRGSFLPHKVATGPVPIAVCWLMIRWGFTLQGKRARRWLSHSSRIWWVSSSIGRVRPAMVSRRLPQVDVIELDGLDGGFAGGVESGEDQNQAAAGVVAVSTACSTSLWSRGWAMP